MTKRTKLILAVLTGIAVVGGGVAIYKATRTKVSYETKNVSRGAIVEQVSVTGSLTSTQKISLQPEVGGRITSVKVKKGALVKAGDLLVAIASKDIEAKIASQRAAVDSARARLAELVAGATSEELDVSRKAVDSAEAKLEAAIAAKSDAQVSLENANMSDANTKAQADTQLSAKVDAMLSEFDDAVNKANDAVFRLTGELFTNDDHLTFQTSNSSAQNDATQTRLSAKSALEPLADAVNAAKLSRTAAATLSAAIQVNAGLAAVKAHLDADAIVLDYAIGVSSSTLASYKQNVSTAQNSVAGAVQAISAARSALEVQQRSNETSMTSASTAVSNAQAAVRSAGFAIDSAQRAIDQAKSELALRQAGNRPEVIASQRAQVSGAEATLASFAAELSKRRITSPIDGIVTEVPVDPGQTVSPGQVVAVVQSKGAFEIVTNISEIDIGRVKVGDQTTITLDAFPRTETWTGKVIRIDPAEKIVEGVIFYQTTVVFDIEDERLRSGMTANLAIETARREDVLIVPIRALRERDNKTYVQVLVAGDPVEKQIMVGIESNSDAEVISGLAEGEAVVVTETKK